MLGVEKIHTKHLNGDKDRIFEIVCGIHDRQRLLQTLAPNGRLVLIVNISAQLQESPHHVREYILLCGEELDTVSYADEVVRNMYLLVYLCRQRIWTQTPGCSSSV